MNKILFIAILTTVVSLDYDEEIYSSVNNPKIYYYAPSYNKRTFHLKISSFSKGYLEFDNYYGKSTIIKGQQTIAILNGQEKYAIFKKENADYYIIFELPSPFEVCGIKIKELDNKFYILESSLTFEYMQQKTFNFKIINEEANKKYVSVILSNYTNYWVTDVMAEENGIKLSPVVRQESSYQLKYIVSITNEINFSFKCHNNKKRNGLNAWLVSLKSEDNYENEEEESKKKTIALTYASSIIAFICILLFVCILCKSHKESPDEYNRIEMLISTFTLGKIRIII